MPRGGYGIQSRGRMAGENEAGTRFLDAGDRRSVWMCVQPSGRDDGVFGKMAVGGMRDSSPTNPSRVALGRFLFHDSRLSRDQKVSCGGCHTLSKFGVDGKPAGFAVGGLVQMPNAPSTFNTQAHIVLFWRTGVPNGEAQNDEALGETPATQPVEMGAAGEHRLWRICWDASLGTSTCFAQGFPQDDSTHLGQERRGGNRGLRARVGQQLTMGQVRRRGCLGSHPGGEERIARVSQDWLRRLPHRATGRRDDVPDARPGISLAKEGRRPAAQQQTPWRSGSSSRSLR